MERQDSINDPTVGAGGPALTSFGALLYNKVVDLDFFRQLVERQQMTMLRDEHLQIAWLARGKFPISLWNSSGRTAEYINAGAPIKWVITKEGVVLGASGGALVLMNKAPHPNAATILINWFLIKEGQLLIQKGVGKQSRRIDISTADLDLAKTRQPGVKYLPDPGDVEEWVVQERNKYREMAREIFTPLTR